MASGVLSGGMAWRYYIGMRTKERAEIAKQKSAKHNLDEKTNWNFPEHPAMKCNSYDVHTVDGNVTISWSRH